MIDHDFGGWATRNDLKCSDGRVIRQDAFKHNDGAKVPLMWGHQHDDPMRILGHAILENRKEGVYAYGKFNNTEQGLHAKELVQNGDVVALSIYANQLRQNGSDVVHGQIKEVSLVWAGANPGAYIDSVIKHGEDSDEEAIIYTGLTLCHSDEEVEHAEEEIDEVEHSEEETEEAVEHSEESKTEDKSVAEVFADAMGKLDELEKSIVYSIIGDALGVSGKEESDGESEEEVKHSEEGESDDRTAAQSDDEDEDKNEDEEVKHSEGGESTMKKNAFEREDQQVGCVLSHADQENILAMAKSSAVGSLKAAMEIYAQDNQALAHAWESIGELFPDYKDVHPGAPELIERDMSWVASVMKKARKSPISRIRTRQADARATELRAKGYNDREIAKKLGGSLKLLMRTTDPQTVYIRDELHRDDITDITDFDVVAYQKNVMKHNYEEVIALAALVGDGREDVDADKIHENHIRPIWKDDELYTIHYDLDTEGTLAELQGSNTNANFGSNFVRAEAMVNAALYSREGYKGKGQVDMYIDPHELNIMLLARDMNGRRIYESRADLAKALNVDEIHTVEQFAGLTRTTEDGKTKKLLALFVNMSNYQFGATKGGELTSFEQFDIDFNKYKYLMEGRLSGALTEIKSAIAIEEDITETEAAG